MEKKFEGVVSQPRSEVIDCAGDKVKKIENNPDRGQPINLDKIKKTETTDTNELANNTTVSLGTQTQVQQAPAAVVKEVEVILAEGLAGVYQQLTPEKKREFKLKGEETAKKVAVLLMRVKLKFKEVFSLISAWLKIIPGINRFFLEQEAKIKADRIVQIHERQMDIDHK